MVPPASAQSHNILCGGNVSETIKVTIIRETIPGAPINMTIRDTPELSQPFSAPQAKPAPRLVSPLLLHAVDHSPPMWWRLRARCCTQR